MSMYACVFSLVLRLCSIIRHGSGSIRLPLLRRRVARCLAGTLRRKSHTRPSLVAVVATAPSLALAHTESQHNVQPASFAPDSTVLLPGAASFTIIAPALLLMRIHLGESPKDAPV